MIELTCSNCGKKILRESRRTYKNVFCNKKCESEFRKGKLNRPKKLNTIRIVDDYAIIEINNNIFGKLECLIDIEDIDKVKDLFWNVRYDKRHPNCTLYVESHKDKKRVHIHRLLVNCPDNMVVDHINGNGLDNRKKNLRIVTQQLNCINRAQKFNKGLSYNKRDDYWVVYVAKRTVGRFKTYEEAKKYREYINELINKGDWDKIFSLDCITITGRKRKTN